jgi:hypothetical protein
VARVIATVAADAANLDRGLPGTALTLFRHPGRVIWTYITGPTGRFTVPARYLVVCSVIGAIVYLQLGWLSTGARSYEPVSAVASEHLSLVLIAQVPVASVISWLLFRRAGLNMAEHMVFNAYAAAQLLLILALTAPVAILGGVEMELYAFLLVSGAVAYYAWAAVDFFRLHVGWDVLRAGAVQSVVLLLYVLVLGFGTGAL